MRALALVALVVLLAGCGGSRHVTTSGWLRVDHVADGDTIVVRDGGKVSVRLVQIDTPEVYGTAECYGAQASAETKRLVHPGSFVRLVRDPALDDRDEYGRLLRYVVLRDGTNLNVHLVAAGFAAPYFFHGDRGAHASQLLADADRARARKAGLWGACPGTPLQPDYGVSTGAA
jgi:micrococcal nuclease